MKILYLDIDTLRPDHLGCYGYGRNTSPNIDRVAASGVRLTNCYCSDAPCLPSRTALVTGQFGIHTGVVGHGGTAADMRLEGRERGFKDRLAQDSLPARLKRAGLHTVTISPFAERHASWSFYAGFREIHDTGMSGGESAEQITPTAMEWIDRNAANDNWFLHINYWDPHTPYRAPAQFGNPFAGQPLPEWLTEQVLAEHRGKAGPHGPRELNMYDDQVDPAYPRQPGEIRDLADFRKFIDGYDCGVAYADHHVGQILAALEAKGATGELAIIISSDHGENLGELGIYGEHATADYPTTRIPMIIRWPGCPAGHVDTGLHYNLDLAPTLAELLGVDRPRRWQGRSYAQTITDGLDAGRQYLVVSQCAHVAQRAVRFGPWMYIRTWHDGYHLLPDEMLFDIAADPHEQNDLAGQQPDICRKGAALLGQWHEEMMRTQPAGYDIDPMQTVLAEGGPFHARGHMAAYCRRLAETGRRRAAEQLRAKYPDEFR